MLFFSTWEIGEGVAPRLAEGCRMGLLSFPCHPLVLTPPQPDSSGYSSVSRASEPYLLHCEVLSYGEESLLVS